MYSQKEIDETKLELGVKTDKEAIDALVFFDGLAMIALDYVYQDN